MEWLSAPDSWLARLLIQRGLGAVYLVVFLTAANQFRPLLGERGLLPVTRLVERVPFRRAPSLFHLRYSDRLLAAVAWTGVGLAGAVLLGLPERGPLWVSLLVWLALWVLYLSIVNVGQVFYAFGWESLLLEAGFLAIFLGPAWVEPPLLVMLAMLWLLFRVEFGAGPIKLRGDPCWRDLTCLYYHHETQPLPNPLSWFFHHLPERMHRIEVATNHVAQLIVPFGLFAPQPIRSIAGAVVLVTQGWLVASGNFSWLNVVAMIFAVAALDDAVLGRLLPFDAPGLADPPTRYVGLVAAVAVLVAVLSYWPVRNMLGRRQLMNATFNPFYLVGTYGAFGSITRVRDEIVLEGTDEPAVTASTAWREYAFKAKPGDVRRRPQQVAPYHLRLDWLMWFAAMSTPQDHPWLLELVRMLLQGDAALLRLLGENPCPHTPPTHVRARLYRYRFTTPRERRGTGDWWTRALVAEYLPPVRLGADGRLAADVTGGTSRHRAFVAGRHRTAIGRRPPAAC